MSLSSAAGAISFIFRLAKSVGTLNSNFLSGIDGSSSIASTVLKAVRLTSSISSVGCLVVSFCMSIPGARSILNRRQSDLARNLSSSYDMPATTGRKSSLTASRTSALTTLSNDVQPMASNIQLTSANTTMLTATTKKMNVVPQRLCSVRILRAFSTVRSRPCS